MEKQPKFDYSDIKFKDNGKLKLIIVVGTRPEIIRLAAVITKCRQYFDVILAHTGQNYDYNLNGIFFKDLKLAEPEVYMDAVLVVISSIVHINSLLRQSRTEFLYLVIQTHV